ncbi:fluoride transporter [Maudiozyma humilis]|uniref:Fluoride transporter n=1 Tax=Maudiozyma humilis TaxID=51915 RepID=A0AAV5S3I5_MAUHU|nr:fluoride transporter [Kazachstania humilis]
MRWNFLGDQEVKKLLHFHLAMISCIFLGNYGREAVAALSTYSPSYVSAGTVLWSNCAGCILMGLFQSLNATSGWFSDYPNLFAALTTGFCGSFSSFSTFMIEVFEYSSNLTNSNLKHHTKLPNRAYGIMEWLSVVIIDISVSMSGLIFGRFLGSEIVIKYAEIEEEGFDEEENKTVRTKPHPMVDKVLKVVYYTLILSAIPYIILIVILAAYYGNYSRGKWTLPPLFGIFGAYCRLYISKWVNPISKKFYFGTFICNVTATLLSAIFTLVLRGRKDYHDPLPIIHTKNACRVVTALMGGFCGSLSTMSTFSNEAYLLPLGRTLVYYSATVGLAYILIVITLGSYAWTRGLTAAYC